MGVYDFIVKDAKGNEISLNEFKGKLLLIVNTATGCGFTPQYTGLQSLYERYQGKGFEISTRAAILCGAFPLELCASLENVLKLPFQTGLALIKLTCKTINLCLDSQSIKNFTDKQPGLTDLLKTALKVVGYAIGAFVTITFGLLRPYDNFRLHATPLTGGTPDRFFIRYTSEHRALSVRSALVETCR